MSLVLRVLLRVAPMLAVCCTQSPRTKNHAPAASHETAVVAPSASVIAATSAAPLNDRPLPSRLAPNLLGLVPAQVAVSSAVRNPRDFPEHLIDGNPLTAWNSKTGDLAGAWMAFRVPRDAYVNAVELAAGYVRVKGSQDLFTMNHRIKRLHLLRDGRLLRAVELDVESRVLQRVVVDAPGGEFKLVVKETQPGTEAKWREVVVSELRVLGRPGASRRAADERLVVSVGSLDAKPPEPLRAELDFLGIGAELRHSYPSVEAFCVAFLGWAKAHAAAEVEEYAQWNDSAPVPTPLCQEVPVPTLQNPLAPFLGARGVRVAWAYRDHTQLLAVTPEGLVPTPITFDDRYGKPMGCPSIWSRHHADRLWVENGWLIVTIDGRGPLVFDRGGRQVGEAYQRGVAMCRSISDGFRCLELNPQYEESLATKLLPSTGSGMTDPETVPWERVEEFRVSPSGELSRLRVR